MKHFEVSTELMQAINTHNQNKLILIDGILLCLIKQHNNGIYLSNKELSTLLICNPSTIQRSIDKLVEADLVTKEISYVHSAPRRHLTINTEIINRFINTESGYNV